MGTNLILCTANIIWKGFVLSKLWGWFIVPIFAWPSVSCAGAIGCLAVVSIITYKASREEESSTESLRDGILSRFSMYLVLFAIGYVASLFM